MECTGSTPRLILYHQPHEPDSAVGLWRPEAVSVTDSSTAIMTKQQHVAAIEDVRRVSSEKKGRRRSLTSVMGNGEMRQTKTPSSSYPIKIKSCDKMLPIRRPKN